MEELVYYSDLYDLYKNLLTDKQRGYFEDYYFKNLSLSEISQNYGVSRNAVHNQVKIVKDLLDQYEEKLMLKEKFDKIEELIEGSSFSDKISDILNN